MDLLSLLLVFAWACLMFNLLYLILFLFRPSEEKMEKISALVVLLGLAPFVKGLPLAVDAVGFFGLFLFIPFGGEFIKDVLVKTLGFDFENSVLSGFTQGFKVYIKLMIYVPLIIYFNYFIFIALSAPTALFRVISQKSNSDQSKNKGLMPKFSSMFLFLIFGPILLGFTLGPLMYFFFNILF